VLLIAVPLLLVATGMGLLASTTEMPKMPGVVAAVLTVLVGGFVLFVLRDEYREGRRDGLSRLRSTMRATRKTLDAFVFGK